MYMLIIICFSSAHVFMNCLERKVMKDGQLPMKYDEVHLSYEPSIIPT